MVYSSLLPLCLVDPRVRDTKTTPECLSTVKKLLDYLNGYSMKTFHPTELAPPSSILIYARGLEPDSGSHRQTVAGIAAESLARENNVSSDGVSFLHQSPSIRIYEYMYV